MRVVRVEGEYAYLSKIDEDFSCHSCALKNVCNRTDATVKALKGNLDLIVGDEVIVELPSNVSTKASILFYTIPLLIFLAVLIVAKTLKLSDIGSFIAGISAMGIYYALLKFKDRKLSERLTPRIISVESRRFSVRP